MGIIFPVSFKEPVKSWEHEAAKNERKSTPSLGTRDFCRRVSVSSGEVRDHQALTRVAPSKQDNQIWFGLICAGLLLGSGSRI